MDKMIQAVTVVTSLFLLLSVLHCSGKVYNELFSYALNATGILACSIFLLVSTLFL